MCRHINKKADVLSGQCYTVKFCVILKKSKGKDRFFERSFPNSDCFHPWNVNCMAGTSKQMSRWSRKRSQSWTHSKEKVWNYHWKNGSKEWKYVLLQSNGGILRNKTSNVLPRKVRMMWMNKFVFVSFCLSFSWTGMHNCFHKTAVTRDLFDIQTSTGACWEGNALQNTCVLSGLTSPSKNNEH